MDICPTIDVFVGHGNVTTLLPYADKATEELLDMSGATKVEVCVGSATTDSDTLPDVVWWEQDSDGAWVIRMRLGLVPSIVEGEQEVRVVVYDADYVDGLVLTHDLPVNVIGQC